MRSVAVVFSRTTGRSGRVCIQPLAHHAVAHVTLLPIGAGHGQALSSPAPRGWTGWMGGVALDGPPSCQLRGRPGGRADSRRLPSRSLARAPSHRLWGSPGRSSGHRYSLARTRTSSFGALLAQSLPPAHPSVVCGPALGAESHRGGAGRCLNHV